MNTGDREPKRYFITTHEYATGPAHSLETYLTRQASSVVFLSHPFVFARDIRSYARLHRKGAKTQTVRFPAFIKHQLISVIKDTIITLYMGLRYGPFDVYIGVDSANTMAGLVLRMLSRVRRVYFYTIDYVPNRFGNRILDQVYLRLDRWAVSGSDAVWNLSDAMITAREEYGMSRKHRHKQIRVPMGTETEGKKPVSISRIGKADIVHMGHIVEEHGVQLIIDALPLIIKKIPDAHVHIIGSGPYEQKLKERVNDLDIKSRVTFHGFVTNHDDVIKKLSRCALGIATYPDTPTSYIRNSDPGKVKAYLSAGLPVIVTKVPEVWKELQERGAGIGIGYDAKALARAVQTILTDEKSLQRYRENAWEMAKDYAWEHVYARAFDASERVKS